MGIVSLTSKDVVYARQYIPSVEIGTAVLITYRHTEGQTDDGQHILSRKDYMGFQRRRAKKGQYFGFMILK